MAKIVELIGSEGDAVYGRAVLRLLLALADRAARVDDITGVDIRLGPGKAGSLWPVRMICSFAPQVRAERDLRLMQTEWIYLPDVAPPEDIGAWEAYRQALRDVPQQVGFPGEVVWPGIE